MDSTRELRSIQMVLFACPPLPIECKRNNEVTIANSHDLLAMLINVAMRRENEKENTKRAERQAELMDEYWSDKELDIEKKMQHFTRQWMMSYTQGIRDVTFLPLDRATPKVIEQVKGWLKAQYVLTKTSPQNMHDLGIKQLYHLCFEKKKESNTVTFDDNCEDHNAGP